jgi:hypothetical protein
MHTHPVENKPDSCRYTDDAKYQEKPGAEWEEDLINNGRTHSWHENLLKLNT